MCPYLISTLALQIPKIHVLVTPLQVQFVVLGAHTTLTLRRLMSYIYMEYPFLMFLDHTQRRSTVGRTPLDE